MSAEGCEQAPEHQPLDNSTVFDDTTLINDYDFLTSPVATLVESVVINYDDTYIPHILDAYSTLSARIREIAGFLVATPVVLPALEILERHNATLCQCLLRDIDRAFVDPLPAQHSSIPEIPDSVNSSTYSASPEEIESAHKSSALCHSALKLLSSILRLPAIYSILPSHDLDHLCGLVLKIVCSPCLPSFGGPKTNSWALWILATIHYTSPTIPGNVSLLVSALRRNLGSSRSSQVVPDSLMVIDNLLHASSSAVSGPLVALLPDILSHIVSVSLDIRTRAALALCALVHHLMTLGPAETHDHLWSAASTQTKAFVDSHVPRRRKGQIPPPGRLEEMLTEALSGREASAIGQGAPWALTVVGCLIILSSDHLFSHSRTLILVVNTLKHAARHRRSLVRRLHTWVWRCLIWAFAQLGSTRGDASARNSGSAGDLAKLKDRPFLLLKQEFNDSAGIALVASLLSSNSASTSDEDLFKALAVLNDMIKSPIQRTHEDGRSILSVLLGAVDPATSSSPHPSQDKVDPILVREMFDGSTLKLSWEDLCLIVPDAGKLQPSFARCLRAAEVERHWEGLLDLWTACTRRALSNGVVSFPMSGDLLGIWQALLLANAQLTQEHRHLTAPPFCAHKTVSVITDLLVSVPVDAAMPPSHRAQLSILVLTKQLWKVMRNVFAASWLTFAAESILTSVLKQKYDIEDDGVRGAWSRLCAALVITSAPDLLSKLTAETEEHGAADLQRHLWTVAAESWKSPEPDQKWEDAVQLLIIPFATAWTMSEKELGCWAQVLDSAIAAADAHDTASVVILERLLARLSQAGKRMSDFPDLSLLVLEHLRITCPVASCPTVVAELSKLLEDLHVAYAELPQFPRTCLQHLRHTLQLCPPDVIIPLLANLSDGLCGWIHTSPEVLIDEDYNELIVPLYSSILDALRGCTLGTEALWSLAPLFTAAFVRCTPPALGPLAFRTFWKKAQVEAGSIIPNSILVCVEGLERAFGDLTTTISDVSIPTEDYTSQRNVSNSFATATAPLGSAVLPAALPHSTIDASHHMSSPAVPIRECQESFVLSKADPIAPESSSSYIQDSPTLGKRRAGIAEGLPLLPVYTDDARPWKRARLQNNSECPGKSTVSQDLTKGIQSQFLPPSEHVSDQDFMRDPEVSDEDYDSWEAAIDVYDINAGDDRASESSAGSSDRHGAPETRDNILDNLHRSLSVPVGPFRHQECIGRSQTAPELRPSVSGSTRHSPRVSRTSSSQVNTLRRLYHAVRDGGSQMPVGEMLAATRLVNEIGSVLNQKLAKKLSDVTGHSRGEDIGSF